jgi:Glycine/D-amino acid oxidases (deaminating)
MLSYWEQQSFTKYDHIVVGAGIVGLSTAIELKEKYPAQTVLVLERGLLPTGASSRNAGFACMGSLTELLDNEQYHTEHEITSLYLKRKQGLELLRNRLGDERIGYRANGSYELLNVDDLPMLAQMEYLNNLLLPITGKPAFALANDKIQPFGFSTAHTMALIENTCEGELNTGKMLRALTDFAISKGVEVKTGAEVVRFDDMGSYVTVEIRDPFRRESLTLNGSTLSICTNAFAKQLLPEVDVVPGRGQVLITDPIPDLKFRGVYHFDKGYYYFREIDGRVLLGGGRNLDFDGEETTEFAVTENIQASLEEKLREVIIPDTRFTIAQRWSGIMAFGSSKEPIVQAFSPRVFGAFRMGGMGVALGSLVGRELVELI